MVFYVRIHKCELIKLEVEFLGHRLLAKGMTPSFPKVEALNAWQPPLRSAKEVRQFIRLALWNKAFIPHLASIAAPLFQLTSTKKAVPVDHSRDAGHGDDQVFGAPSSLPR